MDVKVQLELAKEAGEEALKDYKYHISMVQEPLPFGQFHFRKKVLDRLLEQDPNGEMPELNERIDEICRELGY